MIMLIAGQNSLSEPIFHFLFLNMMNPSGSSDLSKHKSTDPDKIFTDLNRTLQLITSYIQ